MAPDHATSLLLLFLFFHVPCNHMFTNKCIMRIIFATLILLMVPYLQNIFLQYLQKVKIGEFCTYS